MRKSGLDQIAFSFLRRVLSVAVVTGILLIWAASPVVAGTEVYTGDPISLDLVDADLENVLTSMAGVTDIIFAVDSQTITGGGLDRTVSVTYESVPWDQALDEILIEAGLEWTLEGKVLWIHLPAYVPAGDRNFTGDAINLRLDDAKLVAVLNTMAQVSGLEIDFDPEIETTVSVNLRSVPWDQVLDLILRISGYGYLHDNGVLTVFKASDGTGMQLLPPSGLADPLEAVTK